MCVFTIFSLIINTLTIFITDILAIRYEGIDWITYTNSNSFYIPSAFINHPGKTKSKTFCSTRNSVVQVRW